MRPTPRRAQPAAPRPPVPDGPVPQQEAGGPQLRATRGRDGVLVGARQVPKPLALGVRHPHLLDLRPGLGHLRERGLGIAPVVLERPVLAAPGDARDGYHLAVPPGCLEVAPRLEPAWPRPVGEPVRGGRPGPGPAQHARGGRAAGELPGSRLARGEVEAADGRRPRALADGQDRRVAGLDGRLCHWGPLTPVLRYGSPPYPSSRTAYQPGPRSDGGGLRLTLVKRFGRVGVGHIVWAAPSSTNQSHDQVGAPRADRRRSFPTKSRPSRNLSRRPAMDRMTKPP